MDNNATLDMFITSIVSIKRVYCIHKCSTCFYVEHEQEFGQKLLLYKTNENERVSVLQTSK